MQINPNDKCELCGSSGNAWEKFVWDGATFSKKIVCCACSWSGKYQSCQNYNHHDMDMIMDRENTFMIHGKYYCPECARNIVVSNMEFDGKILYDSQHILRRAGIYKP